MWQVIAPVVRWPLYSVPRLLAVLGALAVVLVLAGNLTDSPATEPGAEPRTEHTTSPSSSSTPGAGGMSTPTPASQALTQTDAVDAPASDVDAETDPLSAAGDVAAGFVTAWARPDLDALTWRQGIQPIVTPTLYEGLATTDPANVPALTVTGAPVLIDDNPDAPVLDVPTTGTYVRVHLVVAGGSWLVDQIEPL